MQAAGELNFLRPRHEQTKGDGLCVAIGKTLVGSIGKEQLSPVGGKGGQGLAPGGELFGDFIPQQAAEAGAHVGEIMSIAWRLGFPPQEAFKQTH